MKLIIDIPEDVVTAIQNGQDYRYDIHTAIAQGIPYEERPQGEWKVPNSILKGNYYCDNCNEFVINKSNFCPNCGAKMQKGGNRE